MAGGAAQPGVLAIVALIGILGLFSIWWLVFVVGVLVAIFLHELGHFTTARWTGMKATQFFIGFGPRVWSFRRGETEYGVRALPLGAFVRIIGMNNMDDVEPEDEDRTYRSKSYPRRMLVISAGSIMHMLLAIVLLFTVYVAEGETYAAGAEIGTVQAGGPAAAAGLQPGDIVVAIDGQTVQQSADLGDIIQSNEPSETLVFQVMRDGETVEVFVAPGANTDEDSPPVRQAVHRRQQRRLLRNDRALGAGRSRERGHRHRAHLVGDDQGCGQGAQPGQRVYPPHR